MDGASHSDDQERLFVTIDWERQTTEQILVTYRIGDHADSIAFEVGKPIQDNLDDERAALAKAVDAAREVVGVERPPTVYGGRKIADAAVLFRLIITEDPAKVRAIYGAPGNPINHDAEGLDEPALAVIAAAHALVAAKLDPEQDTAS
jgi:hypothetical protein